MINELLPEWVISPFSLSVKQFPADIKPPLPATALHVAAAPDIFGIMIFYENHPRSYGTRRQDSHSSAAGISLWLSQRRLAGFAYLIQPCRLVAVIVLFCCMINMFVLMGTVIPAMIVIMYLLATGMTVRVGVLMIVSMGMQMMVLMGMSLSTMLMLMAVGVFMLMIVLMFVTVITLH